VNLTAQTPAGPQSPSAAASQDPTFRLSTRYVEVDAVVRDRNGRFVTGLTADDFEVFENDKKQTIDKVTSIDLPPVSASSSLLDSPLPLPGNQGGRGAGGAAPDTSFARAERVYVMVLDSGRPDDVKRLAREFIDRHLGPSDLMAVVHVSGIKGQALTSNKALLRAAVGRFRLNFNDEALLGTLKEVAVSLGSVTGRRRGIILFSLGFWGPRSLWSVEASGQKRFVDGEMDARWSKYHDMMRTARAFNVPIHSMYGAGMTVPLLASADEPAGVQASLPSLRMGNDSLADGPRSMSMLADHTGGIDLGNINGASKRFGQVVEENSRYYMIGYYSNVEPDGLNHPIVVRTTRADATVNARRGVEPRPLPGVRRVSPPRELTDASRDLLVGRTNSETIRVSTSTSVFRAPDFMGAVLVASVAQGDTLNLNDGQKLRYSAAALDVNGNVIAVDSRAFTFNLKAETRTRIRQDGMQFVSRLVLPLGTHIVRVLVEQPGLGTGTASTRVTVPDFAATTLSFSDLNIGLRGSSPLTPLNDRTVRQELSAGLTRRRAFVRSDELQIFGEVYDVHWPLVPRLDVEWTIRPAGSDQVVASGEGSIESAVGGRAQFRGRVPLRGLTPGIYRLEAGAISRLGPPATAMAQLQFIVLGEAPSVSDSRSSTPPIAVGSLVAGDLRAQDAGPTFDIVSLRRGDYNCPDFSLNGADCPPVRPTWTALPDGRVELANHLAMDLIRVAYGVERLEPRYVTGGPRWLWDERYDLIALTGRDGGPIQRASPMDGVARERLRAMLEDRFKLRSSIVKKDMDILVLTRMNGAATLALTPTDDECEPGQVAPGGVELLPPPCALRTRPDGIDARGITMTAVAQLLSTRLGMPVVDETGGPQRFDVSLNWPLARGANRTIPVDGINSALKPIGLEVRKAKRPIDTLVIHSVERPEEDR
jgi:uncharacterized protein (TIGR03435 family)